VSGRSDSDIGAAPPKGAAPKEKAGVVEPSSGATGLASEEGAQSVTPDAGALSPAPPVADPSTSAPSSDSDAESAQSPAASGAQTGPFLGLDSVTDDGGEQAAEVQDDLDELVATVAQRDEYLALAQRTQADFENYRKRMGREVRAAESRGVVRLVKELLPALDNLERALDAAAHGEGSLTDGVRLVRSDLLAALKRVGVEAYSPEGETFDPQCHEAMAQQPVEGTEPGTVVEVYQAGYRLGETVIRPARVVVSA
jgi:molecular chaperone GrpE